MKELDTLQPPEYFPSEAVALVKGEAARTSFLVGCFVPVVLYEERAVLGHFGPGRVVEAHYKLLTQCLGLNNPSQVVVYRVDLTLGSFWSTRVQEYESHYQELKNIVADVTTTPLENILEKTYPHYSKIRVDWTKGDWPNILIENIKV